jgi:hypothetical protein
MRKGHQSTTMLVAGILGIALGGCGNSTNGSAGSGGKTSGSGGAAEGGSGGTTGTGGTALGGTTGSGGTTAQTGTGGMTGSGGSAPATGGAAGGTGDRIGGTGGSVGGTTGTSTEGTGGAVASGGVVGGTSGATGGAATGGRTGTVGRGGTSGGGTIVFGGSTGAGGASGTGGRTSTGTGTGTCTASKDAGKTVSGSGPHKVTIESNSDAGINCGTIYRPTDLGGAEKYPIFVWGEGGCSQSGTSNQAAMGEIASHGYFIVADGVASGTACSGGQDGKAMLDYITWAIAENDKSCSAYYQSLDTTKIAADGFSCGGLMAENISGDPRFTAIGITSSGLFSADQNLYKKIHTPFKILLGGSGDMAYTNGERDYTSISALGIPILLLSKDGAGHGGDLGNAKGDFNTVNLAWLNWQLKGDEGATGKTLLVGSSCKYCNASGWEFKSANLP